MLLVLTWVEPTSLTEDFSLSQAEALEFTINNYNNQSDEEYAFCVLETQPQPDWDPTLSEPQSLYFTIKETECKMVENLTLEQCPFKDNGQVKNCLAIIETSGEGLSVELTCEPQNPAEAQERRFVRKVKRKLLLDLRKFLQKMKKMIGQLVPKRGH
uniref:Vipericidin n=1 Tax=Loxodonta africana TaxID=9785 RepID=G3UA57_LOXAF